MSGEELCLSTCENQVLLMSQLCQVWEYNLGIRNLRILDWEDSVKA